MVFSVQTWWHVTWRPTAIWASFNKQNRRKHSKNSRCDNVWLSSNNRRVGRIDWSFVELMSTNFNRRTPRIVARSGEWLLHHDNAPAHTAFSVRQFLTKNGMTTVSHPPTPRTWHPAIFSCFQEYRGTLKESVFRSRGGEGKNDGSTEGYHFASVPELFWTMEKAVG